MKFKINRNWYTCALIVAFYCCIPLLRGQDVLSSKIPENIMKEWPDHPRLLFNRSEEARVKKQISDVPLSSAIFNRLLLDADSLVHVPVQDYVLHKGYIQDILSISREQVYRTVTLAMAYRMTHDTRYLQKCEQELVNICRFPNWNPVHYLDVAEMTTAVAIGYDWLYHDLSMETRKIIVQSIKEKALDHAIREYEQGKGGSWAKRETNWNVVCNTGMVMGAMAVAEDYPETANIIVSNAVKFIPNYLKHFAPDGVCFEGPAYWGYTNIYLTLLLSVLNNNFGHDFGLSELEGIQNTVQYYMDTTSPAGKIFNFANSSDTNPDTNPTYFYFSKNFGQINAAVFYRDLLSKLVQNKKLPKGYFFLALPWFDNREMEKSEPSKVLQVYEGINDIATFRTNVDNSNAIYLIAKGGAPDEAHQQMDVGTFIIESGGVRWSDDLGADNYDLPGFWDSKPNGKRWSYFRNSNFSHNTLTIDNQVQYAKGNGKLIAYDDLAKQPYFVIDMSSAYAKQARSVIRTFKHLSDTKVRITDDVLLLNPGQEVRWSMITSAVIDCKDKVATLHKDGKQFRVSIKGPKGAVFEVKEVPPTEGLAYPIVGYQLLQVTVKTTSNVKIEIEMESKS